MAKPVIPEPLKKATAEAFWGMFVGDSIAMPVHWYYNPSDIVRDHKKWLTGYVAPKNKHPSSILRLSAGDGSGRGSTTKKSVVGNVILHDKLKYWTGESSSNHYHQGMSAGDNTLNCVMALHEMQTMNRVDPNRDLAQRDLQAAVLEDYVSFMTTPGSHNDTYAESFHRSFFKDWVEAGQPKSAEALINFVEERSESTRSKGAADSQLVVIGALVPAIPLILHHAHKSETECAQATVDFIKLTHPVQPLIAFVDIYACLLHGVLNGKDLKSEVLRVFSNSSLGGPGKRDRVLAVLDKAAGVPKGSKERLELYQALTAQLGMACYIDGALGSMLLLALEFHDDFEGGVLANANCGGENCHRGAALGALLGAASAQKGPGVPQHLKDGLHSLREDIRAVTSDRS